MYLVSLNLCIVLVDYLLKQRKNTKFKETENSRQIYQNNMI